MRDIFSFGHFTRLDFPLTRASASDVLRLSSVEDERSKQARRALFYPLVTPPPVSPFAAST